MKGKRIVVHATVDMADEVPWYPWEVKEYAERIEKVLKEVDLESVGNEVRRIKESGGSSGLEAVSEPGNSLNRRQRKRILTKYR